ncbi:RNA polymerase II elongation factor [Steccherinum ochraceum]|uniref:Transcription elongation factor n=1 Tax=Steccherinum ochraceum TaxID=92696 RepID=A0A4R0RLP3_9APHY|nr:RNA polymerase II elongation factor [Steccherinum ochraceum]
MSAVSELKTLVKSLQRASTDEETVGILQTLKKEARVTEAVLRESKAGLAVGKLRTHASKNVADLAKEIVKMWKNAVEKEKLGNGGKAAQSSTSSTAAPASKPPVRKLSVATASQSSTPQPATPTSSNAKGNPRNAASDAVKIGTGDSTRDKCAELIYDALAADSGAPVEQILSKAKGIEATIHADNGGVTPGYKAKIRSLYVNLKDKNNPSLRESIVAGDLLVARFCQMSSAEMASEERKAADHKIREENLFKTLGAEEVQAETDAFQCGRCKQRKCRYRQAQTRSADEPMTTFVTCTVCNNRWKFS